MKKKLLIPSLFLLSGCATIFDDSKDLVSVTSEVPDTKISVDGNYIGKGSVQYAIPRGKTAIITAEKKGCQSRSIQTEKTIAGMTWLNLFFWPGFIVDAATGAIQKTDPTSYNIAPNCGID